MNSGQINVTLPPGRFIQGNLYTMNEKDRDGKVRVIKEGPKAGTPSPQLYFAVAIPKKPGEATMWDTEWGKVLLTVAARDFPQFYQRPDFAWKVIDGDSPAINKEGKKWNDYPNFPGNWIVRFTSSFPVSHHTIVGRQPNDAVPLPEKDAIAPGFWIQVAFGVVGNGNQKNPGIYLNPTLVCLIGYDVRIVNGPDPKSAGFGVGVTLPAGVSSTPPAGAVAAPAPAVAMPPAPGPVAMPPAPVPAVAMPPAPQAAVPVQPHPAITQPGAPPAPVVPVAGPVHRMTAKASGTAYENFIAQNWTDALLVQHGYMEPF